MERKIKKIALFGGSFNPIHQQHVKIIEMMAKNKIVDEVWVIPCKKHAFNKDFAPARHRINMIRLALKNIRTAKINRVELDAKGTTYTINTINTLRSKYPHRFFWVIGSDILSEIHKWKSYKKLFKKTEFIVFKRKEYPLKKITGMRMHPISDLGANNISSTKIRNYIQEGKSLKNLVPSPVEEYIKKEGLYK